MKVLSIFALTLTLAAATAVNLTKGKLKSRNIVVPAGRPEGRITRGQTAAEGQFPYQVGISLQDYDGNLSWCGGSLLSNTKVLTAAHCTDDMEKGWAYLGSNNWQSAEVVRHFIEEDIIFHHGWIDGDILINDISIITIPYTAYSNTIQPIKLPAASKSYSSFDEEEVLISGWGYPSDHSKKVVSNLLYANRTVISNNVCASYYAIPINPSNICIATTDGTSACSGDSGGPMVLAKTKEQIGIVSFINTKGCELGTPAVFTRVTKYLKWIKTNAGI